MRIIMYGVMRTIPTSYGWTDVEVVRCGTYENAERFITEEADCRSYLSEMKGCFNDLWIRKVFVYEEDK